MFFLFKYVGTKKENGRNVVVIRNQKQRTMNDPFYCVPGKGWLESTEACQNLFRNKTKPVLLIQLNLLKLEKYIGTCPQNTF